MVIEDLDVEIKPMKSRQYGSIEFAEAPQFAAALIRHYEFGEFERKNRAAAEATEETSSLIVRLTWPKPVVH